MKYYLIKGPNDSLKDYVPILDVLKNCEIITPTIDMFDHTPRVEDNSTIIGFSLGALVGLAISKKQPIKKLVACSMSPFLDDDIEKLPKGVKKYIAPHIDNLKKINYEHTLANGIHFFCGSKEVKLIKYRTQKMSGTIIDGVGHKLSKKYIKKILEVV